MSRRRVSTTAVLVTGLVVALLLAGVVSLYASSSPDALTKVAQDQGLSRTQREHAAAGGPLAGYGVRGVDDKRLSGALAGVVGSVVVLVLAGGLTFAVRRRSRGADREPAGQA